MFFIKSGKVAAVFPKYDNFRFLKIKPGYYFGELDILFYSNIRRYAFMATQDSEFFILSRRHFKQIFLVEFRDIGEEFVQDAYLRKKRTKKIYLEALAACKANFRKKKAVDKKSNQNSPRNSNHNSPKHSNDFLAKESAYNLNGHNIGFAFNKEKFLLKKSFELQQEKENELVSSMRKENDYFFKEEIIDNPEVTPIKIDEDPGNINNIIENSKKLNDSLIEQIENSENLKDPETKNHENLENYPNLKLILTHSEESNVQGNNKNMPIGPSPTPMKKSLAAYTFQKVLNINKMNSRRMNLGDSLRKSAQKEALKDKIKFFTDRINKMDQDINNLISFSKQLQKKYQDKIEALKPKPIPRRKLVKTHTLSHINFIKSDSIKKKLNKLAQNTKARRKSDTTTAHSFLANLKTLEKPLPLKNSTEDLKKEKEILKIPGHLRLQKAKDALLKNRRSSVDVGRKLERIPSLIFKRKESLLEEGSLVSHEEQNLRDSMVKIKDKINVSKNILNSATRRGSEMLSYRGSKSPKSMIGKNIFHNNNSASPQKKETFYIELKPLRRTGARRKSDQFVDLLKGFQKNESGFFIENTNKSSRKLSRKATLNSEDDNKNNKKQLKNFRRNSEQFKSSFFSKTFKNVESLAKFANKSLSSSEDNSNSLTPKTSKQTSNVKKISEKSFKNPSLKSSSEKSSKNPSVQSSEKSSLKSAKKILKRSFEKTSKNASKKDSNKFSMSYLSEEIVDNTKSLKNLELLDIEELVKGVKELEGEEKELLEGIEGIQWDIMKKNEQMGKETKMKQIGKLKFVVDLAGSPKKT